MNSWSWPFHVFFSNLLIPQHMKKKSMKTDVYPIGSMDWYFYLHLVILFGIWIYQSHRWSKYMLEVKIANYHILPPKFHPWIWLAVTISTYIVCGLKPFEHDKSNKKIISPGCENTNLKMNLSTSNPRMTREWWFWNPMDQSPKGSECQCLQFARRNSAFPSGEAHTSVVLCGWMLQCFKHLALWDVTRLDVCRLHSILSAPLALTRLTIRDVAVISFDTRRIKLSNSPFHYSAPGHLWSRRGKFGTWVLGPWKYCVCS